MLTGRASRKSSLHHLKELPTRSALLLLGGDKAGNWERWYRGNIPAAEQLYRDYTGGTEGSGVGMPKKAPQDWETLGQELYSAGVEPTEVKAGSRRLPAGAHGHQLAEARKQCGQAQRDVAARMGVSIARVSQMEHGEGATFDVIARHIEALRGRLDLVADFGDQTLRMPASGDQGHAAA
ncbi:helix-turn-helix domain-containing protein [Streptomyces sp. NPDC127197]|uniref:helix-turn-helix domain-containing protein n=1 Tax=Streptomyces sp. NPDC127197 TaxID=3345388 RepID=UPI003631AD19